jgi:hypothetical protein
MYRLDRYRGTSVPQLKGGLQKRHSCQAGLLASGLALFATLLVAASAHASIGDFENFGFESVTASSSVAQAGAHPDFTNGFRLNGDPNRLDGFGRAFPWGDLRNLSVSLPEGLTGNPAAFPTCRIDVFTNSLDGLSNPDVPQCPVDSQIGIVAPGLWNFFPQGFLREPLYNLESPGGDVVARIGFFGIFFPIFVDVKVDPSHNDALVATVVNTPATASHIDGSDVTIWGVPTDSSHDSERFNPVEAFSCFGACEPHPSGLGQRAFMSNPTSCGLKGVGFAANNYALPSRIVSDEASLGEVTNCEAVPFEPTMSLRPTSKIADSPSGVDVSLSLPQEALSDPTAIRTSDLKDAKVTLPKGFSLNAASAGGLEGCSESEVGLVSKSPTRFNDEEAHCPNAANVGTVEIATPVLEDPLKGALYVAKQYENPFGSLLAGYIVAKGKGIIVKQAARFELDQQTGQLTAIVQNAPQQPFSSLEMHLKGGARGVLQTPNKCGTYTSEYELTPWSGNASVKGSSSFVIDAGCSTGGFSPKLSAGVTNPVGGAYSPFVFDVTREDGEQNIGSLEVKPPKGETAKLAGVSLCPDADATAGDCPARSRIGSVNAAVGAGTLPLWVPQPGRAPTAVYLAGPYEKAPYSIVAKVPAQAGPFDLGVVTVRSGIYIDPETAKVTVRSDPLPQILQGIPVSYRRVHVSVDRSRFSLNPTSCAQTSVNATLFSSEGKTATPSDRFEVGGCRELPFKPSLSLRLHGGTRRGAHPRLRAVLRMKSGGANLARVQVALPRSEFLDNAHFKTICTRVQFAAQQCPAGSVYGRASVSTPLLDHPLRGPVYLRSSSHQLPDLVLDLNGQIHVILVGRVDSVNGGLRSTFESTPDAPFSKATLEMQGGKKGLFVNSTNLCTAANRATVRFVGQNGKIRDSAPLLANECKGK